MLPESVVIQSSSVSSARWKLFGQSLLERNIRILKQAGAGRIYLDLNDSDLIFYESKVKKHILQLPGSEVIIGKPDEDKHLLISANHFLLFSAFSKFEENFILLNGIYQPVKKQSQYIIENNTDFSGARKFALEVIRTGSGGKIAQNINKRISIPLSLLFARFRVLPNVITIVNFFIGVLAIALLFSNRLIDQAAGGILVQLCSIIDGCDGEVARMTTRFSKLGGLLDTVSDQLLAAALIAVSVVKVYQNFPFPVFLINMIGVVGGVGIMMGIIVYFMKHYSESMSFASYDREFLAVLPPSDKLAKATRYLQYLSRKELYSMMVCLFCLFGALHYYMLFFTLVAVIGVILMLILNHRYFPTMERIRD